MKLIWFLFSFKGRIQRLQYWIYTVVIVTIILFPAFYIFESFSEEANNYINIMSLVLFWPNIAVQTKRWHDRNKSAWWLLINLVPLIGFIWVIIENGFLAGSKSSNSFGEPYGVNENRI